jgi:hypothetical protein
MRHVKIAAAGFAVAGALGLATLGIGSTVANAAPPMPGSEWAQDHGGHGPGGHGHWGDPWRPGPRWEPPPPPPSYGYGGYYLPPPCITGPLGYVQICA